MASAHQTAREAIRQAWRELTGAELSPVASQVAQSVALHESNYGNPGRPAVWQGSNNWGAVQNPKDKPPCDSAQSFLFEDFNPKKGVREPVCFRRYATPAAGAKDFLRELYVRRPGVAKAADAGDLDMVALAMYDTHYFTGELQDKDPAVRRVKNAAVYASALEKGTHAVAAGVPEALLASRRGAVEPLPGTVVVPGEPERATAVIVGVAALGGLALFAATRRR